MENESVGNDKELFGGQCARKDLSCKATFTHTQF